ncbi:PREDICTED: probable peptide/nitrate transporter At1g59740-like [Fragaria vesca subsp. vesca]
MKKQERQGGFKANYFIFAMMFLDNIGFVANMVNLVLYFMFVIHFDISGSATTTTNYLGTAFLLTIVGGFISDAYMNRLNTTLLFGVTELLGYMLLIIQSHYKKLQPLPCEESICVHGTKALLFYASISLIGLGGGGIRGAIPALGADQFNYKKPEERKHIASFFNWLLLSITVGAVVGVTFVVYVSTRVGWDIGFIISLSCAAAGLFIVALGKPYYRVRVAGESPLLRVLQVLVASVKNWKVDMPQSSDELHESTKKRERIPHTDQFRLLDKAAILPKGVDAATTSKWKVCTVTQVEEVKILTRMMPILLSTILMNTCLAQLQTLSVQQGILMNTRIGSFDVPAATIPVIPLLFMSFLIPIYEFTFVPLLRKFTGNPNGITHLQRVGVGLVLSAISMTIAGFVEVKRKHEFIHHNHKISLFWLAFHYAIFGIADMFTLVGLMEFFYREAPTGMRSLSTSFSWLSLSIGYYLSSAFVELVNSITGNFTDSKLGWLEGRDMNKNHIDYFYWFLAILSVLNFANYLFWANWYTYKNDVTVDEEMVIKADQVGADTSQSASATCASVSFVSKN